MAVKTRSMKKAGLSKRREYRRRVAKSTCRGKRARSCTRTPNCKLAKGKKRTFCRKHKNAKTAKKH